MRNLGISRRGENWLSLVPALPDKRWRCCLTWNNMMMYSPHYTSCDGAFVWINCVLYILLRVKPFSLNKCMMFVNLLEKKKYVYMRLLQNFCVLLKQILPLSPYLFFFIEEYVHALSVLNDFSIFPWLEYLEDCTVGTQILAVISHIHLLYGQ